MVSLTRYTIDLIKRRAKFGNFFCPVRKIFFSPEQFVLILSKRRDFEPRHYFRYPWNKICFNDFPLSLFKISLRCPLWLSLQWHKKMSRPQYIFAISLTSPGMSLGKKLSILVKYSHKGTNIISTKVLDTKEGVTSSAKVWMSRPQENVPSARFFDTKGYRGESTPKV